MFQQKTEKLIGLFMDLKLTTFFCINVVMSLGHHKIEYQNSNKIKSFIYFEIKFRELTLETENNLKYKALKNSYDEKHRIE